MPRGAVIHTCLVPPEDISNWSELLVSLHSVLVIQNEELDDYDNQYLRRLSGPVKTRVGESDDEVEIGRIELWYIDGSCAADNSLDIVDVCDSIGQAEYEYATAIYTNGSVDTSILDGPFSNDALIVHALVIEAEHRGQGMEARIIRKIGQTLGYHCAAVVFYTEQVGLNEQDDLGLQVSRATIFPTPQGHVDSPPGL